MRLHRENVIREPQYAYNTVSHTRPQHMPFFNQPVLRMTPLTLRPFICGERDKTQLSNNSMSKSGFLILGASGAEPYMNMEAALLRTLRVLNVTSLRGEVSL